MHRRNNFIINGLISVIVILIVLFGVIVVTNKNSQNTNTPIKVVAAENFWGSLVSQLGGNKVKVTTIVSDPNADPHEYESNNQNARDMAQANYVILNGAGYDSWGDKLLSSNNNPSRKVLKMSDLLGKKEGDNPHFWYNPDYVNVVVLQMRNDLDNLDPKDSSYFNKNYLTLQSSLSQYQNRITQIKRQFAGTKVAATEDIFAYMAQAASLDMVSPAAFTQAVSEGNDPPTDSVVQFQNQINSGQVKLLVYNKQTVTPLTESIKKLAADNSIPVVGITETIQPPGTSFQVWMNSQLMNIENALNANALGQ